VAPESPIFAQLLRDSFRLCNSGLRRGLDARSAAKFSPKPNQAQPSKSKQKGLVLFARIGTYQWVAPTPNKKFPLVLLTCRRLLGNARHF
jgi:hypothetical protein